jgi:hypothetical protein
MKSYKIVDLIVLNIAQCDEYIKPSESLTVECDGSTVWLLRSSSERIETTTNAYTIDVWVRTGRLLEIGDCHGVDQ